MAGVAVLLVASSAAAQVDPEEGDVGESPIPRVAEAGAPAAAPQEGDDTALPPEVTTEERGPTRAGVEPRGEARRAIVVIAGAATPGELHDAIRDLASATGVLLSDQEYERAARARGLHPMSDAALRELLPEGGADLAVIVAATGSGRSAQIVLTYRSGRTGETLLREVHGAPGGHLPEAGRVAIRDELRLLLRMTAGHVEAEEATTGAPEVERHSTVRLRIEGGLGLGFRSFKLPSAAGFDRLSLGPFASFMGDLGVEVIPDPATTFGWGIDVRYFTSLGLRVTDVRADGTERNAFARVQRFEALASGELAFGVERNGPRIGLAIGYAVKDFYSPSVLSVPDYGLGGPLVRLLGAVPAFDGALIVSLSPEIHYLSSVGAALDHVHVEAGSLAVGGAASARVHVSQAFAIEAQAQLAFASLASGQPARATDDELFISVAGYYRP
jgi:hypothetical protein